MKIYALYHIYEETVDETVYKHVLRNILYIFDVVYLLFNITKCIVIFAVFPWFLRAFIYAQPFIEAILKQKGNARI